MREPDDQETPQNPASHDNSGELRWQLIRIGVRLGIGLLVVAASLWLILSAD